MIELVVTIVVLFSVTVSYLAVYYSDWIECAQCEKIYRSTPFNLIDKSTNTVYSPIAEGMMLYYCDKCRGYL